MLGLLDQLETESPEDISLAPKVGLVGVIDTVTLRSAIVAVAR